MKTVLIKLNNLGQLGRVGGRKDNREGGRRRKGRVLMGKRNRMGRFLKFKIKYIWQSTFLRMSEKIEK